MFFEEYNEEEFDDSSEFELHSSFDSAKIGMSINGLPVYSLKKMIDVIKTPDFDAYDSEDFIIRMYSHKDCVIIKDN
jgi:hypothetical protein